MSLSLERYDFIRRISAEGLDAYSLPFGTYVIKNRFGDTRQVLDCMLLDGAWSRVEDLICELKELEAAKIEERFRIESPEGGEYARC